jgi:hypothetical protein
MINHLVMAEDEHGAIPEDLVNITVNGVFQKQPRGTKETTLS